MSNELDIFSQGTAVANQSDWDDGITSRVSASSSTSKRISFNRNRFVIKVNGNEVNQSNNDYLDVIVINAADVSRMYYAQGYNAKATEKVRPICWTSNSQVPDAAVPHAQGTSCASCPQNIKGSGPNNTKACRFERRLAVVLATQDTNGNWHFDDEIYQMKLASTSIFGTGPQERRPFNEYGDYLKANNAQFMGVVTRITFDTSAPVDKVGFRAVGRLTHDQFLELKTLQATEESRRAITITVAGGNTDNEETSEFAPTTAKVSAPAPVQQAPQQTAPIQNAQPQHPIDSIPEPTVRSTSKPVQEAPTKVDLNDVSLDDLVGDWA